MGVPGVEIRPARADDVAALIDLTRRSWLAGNCELAPMEAVRHWLEDDFEANWYPEQWPRSRVAWAEGKAAGGARKAHGVGIEGRRPGRRARESAPSHRGRPKKWAVGRDTVPRWEVSLGR